MPASQAGRRGFEPRLPLHVFNDLGTSSVSGVTAITAISSRSPRGAAGGRSRTLQPNPPFPRKPQSRRALKPRRLPKVSLQKSALELSYGCQPCLEVALSIFIFV